jgi:hypothetical protein
LQARRRTLVQSIDLVLNVELAANGRVPPVARVRAVFANRATIRLSITPSGQLDQCHRTRTDFAPK